MEPLNDNELRQLLQTWKAPAKPAGMRPPPLRAQPWYKAIWTTSVRVPVPVLVLAMALLLVYLAVPRQAGPHPSNPALQEVRLSDFQPVPEVRPVVIRRIHNDQSR
jgi:hypothetical protein